MPLIPEIEDNIKQHINTLKIIKEQKNLIEKIPTNKDSSLLTSEVKKVSI